MISQQKITKIKAIFKLFPQIKLVYLFGSRASGNEGPLSDYDFAVYMEEKNKQKRSNIRLRLMVVLNKLLKSNTVDIVILNDTAGPELKYNIIKEGILIYNKSPFKVLIEPRIMNEYFDFHLSLQKYCLTKA